MEAHPLHQAILCLSRDHQLPTVSHRLTPAALVPALIPVEEPAAAAEKLLADPNLLRRLLLAYAEKVISLETRIAADAPKVAFHDAFVDSGNVQSIQDVAKVLGIGPAKFFEWLRRAGMLMPGNLPYQCHIDAGHFKVIQCSWTDKKDARRLYARSMVTGKGLAYLQHRYQNESQEPVVAGVRTTRDVQPESLFAA